MRPLETAAGFLLDLTIDGTIMAATATSILWNLTLGEGQRYRRRRMFERNGPSMEQTKHDGHSGSLEPTHAVRQERGLAKGFFDWSTGTIISNLADNPELGPLVRRLVDEILPELAEDPEMAPLVRAQAGAYLTHLQREPEQIEPLVRVLIGRYLAFLCEHPEQLTPLVHELGDEYIAYLNEHPERVQGLIQRQSSSLAIQVTNQVRGRMVTADTFAERLARSLFRRNPREQLPEPPLELKTRVGYSSSDDGGRAVPQVLDK